MCYIFNFFAWTLDLIQRIITFALACLIAFAVCFGMSIAIIAGIAYGYNYSLAEFLTFSRSDVTVFMRRGQFFDSPNTIFAKDERNSGERDDNYQGNNLRSNSKLFSAPRLETKDTRKYAEMLTKFSTKNSTTDEEHGEKLKFFKPTTLPFRNILVTDIPHISTDVWLSGSSEIIMRNFQPIDQLPVFGEIGEPGIEGSEEKINSSFMQMRPVYNPPRILDYTTEDIDEDTIAYKPV